MKTFLLLAVAAAICSAFPSTWTQVNPILTDFELYQVIEAGSSYVIRAGTDRDDDVYPSFLTTSSLSSQSFALSEAPVTEDATLNNQIHQELAYVESLGLTALVRGYPDGTTVLTSETGAEWTVADTWSDHNPGMLSGGATEFVATVYLADDTQGFRVGSGSTWTLYPSPFATGFGAGVKYIGNTWYVYRYDLGSASNYAFSTTTDFQTFTNVTGPTRDSAGYSEDTVIDIIDTGSNGLVAVINNVTENSISYYTIDGSEWTYVGSASVGNAREMPVVSMCGDITVVDNDGTRTFYTPSGNSTTPINGTASYVGVVGSTSNQCSVVATGDYGYLATLSDTNGIEWSVTGNGLFTYLWTSIFYQPNDSKFYILGDSSIWSSSDGSTWTSVPNTIEYSYFTYNAEVGLYIALSSENLWTTDDLTQPWNTTTLDEGIVAVATGNGVWVYADGDGIEGHLYTSSDPYANDWKETKAVKGSDEDLGPVWSGVVYSGGEFYAYAQYTTYPKLYHSSDGEVWIDMTFPSLFGGCHYTGLILGTDKYMYFQCSDEAAVYVYNGEWTKVVTYDDSSIDACTAATVSYLNATGEYVIQVGPNAFVSTDGVSFSAAANVTSFDNTLRYSGVASDGDTYVTLGEFCDTDGGSFIFNGVGGSSVGVGGGERKKEWSRMRVE